ncbi:Fc.00g050580.m01.CDS01 [Cosmosporella sp. VM-42]
MSNFSHDGGVCPFTESTRSNPWIRQIDPLGIESMFSSEDAGLSSAKDSRVGTTREIKKASSRQCTLRPAHKHGWKPETMRAPVLLTFATASLLLAALLEVLAHQSQKAGGLSLVKDADSLPAIVTFGYLYLPTVLAVIYSLAWNWVDLDVKRMQPWLELSRESGATGHGSLFLDYPFDFVAFVPFKAARRKHWAVLYSGTIMTLIFFLITPLQSAVLGTGEVLVKKPTTITTTKKFMDPLAQAATLDQAVLNTGYAITWLNQPYPAFTTAEYALLPFEPEKTPQSFGTPTNWTGTTTKYWTELNCWPAEINQVGEKTLGMGSFDNGQGCNATGIVANTPVPGRRSYKMRYIGYQNSAWAEYCLGSRTCGIKAEHQFLAIWSLYDGHSDTVDIRGTFCETSYHKQNVTATVRAADMRPIDASIKPLSDAETLSISEFNSSAFEYLMGAGVSSVTMPREYPFTHLIEHSQRLNNTGLEYPVAPMIGFAIGGQNYTINDYSNDTVMGTAFKAAHKQIFSVGINHILVNSTTPGTMDGDLAFASYGVVVSRAFSAVVEAFLCVVAMLALMLLWNSHANPSMLSDDPGSLGALINVVHNSQPLLKKFAGRGNLSDEQLQEALGNYKFQLLCGCQNDNGASVIQVLDQDKRTGDSDSGKVVQIDQPHLTKQTGHYSPIKPIALRKPIGALFTLFLCAGIIVLIVLKKQEEKLGGLIRPSSSFEVNLILTSFLPTAFATLVEPFWVLLNRLLCILQPFQDLWSKKRAAERSLKARYTAVPPQLALLGAAKSGHFLLVSVCVIALLANVLAIGLGGLFNDAPIQATYPLTVLPAKNAKFTDQGFIQFFSTIFFGETAPYEDPYYVIMANLSSSTPLPPWTTSEYVFLPVNLTLDAKVDANNYTTKTIGFGAEPSCISIDPITTVDLPPVLNTSFGRPNPPEGYASTYQPLSMFLNSTMYSMPEGRSSAEVVDTMANPNKVSDGDEVIIFGWSRADIQNRTGTLNTSFVVCLPVLKRATFEVSFDAQGYIYNATRASDFETSSNYPNSTTHYKLLIKELNHVFQNQALPWHNDTLSYGWLDYLLKIQTGNERLLDPTVKTPDPHEMLQPVTQLYKLLFAVFVSLNQYLLEDRQDEATLSGIQGVTETRIFVSMPAFIASLTILSLYVLAAIFFYGWGVNFFLPRMPTTIGSLVAYVAPSRIVQEYSSRGFGQRKTFGFGRFVGDDGRAHIGIEFSDRVVPVKVSSLEKGNTMPVKTTVRRLWHRTRPTKQGDVWL